VAAGSHDPDSRPAPFDFSTRQVSALNETELASRFDYHQPDALRTLAHESLRGYVKAVAEVLNNLLPEGSEKACAFTALEECAFWAQAAIARQGPPDMGVTNSVPAPQPVSPVTSNLGNPGGGDPLLTLPVDFQPYRAGVGG
jgi:hypothetical protein